MKLVQKDKAGSGLISITLGVVLTSITLISTVQWYLSFSKDISKMKNNFDYLSIISEEMNKLDTEDYYDQVKRVNSLPTNSSGEKYETFKADRYTITKIYGKTGEFTNGICDTSKEADIDKKGCRSFKITITDNLNKQPYELSSVKISSNTAASLPTGAIIPYSGKLEDMPPKFHLCDGTNGTPDLRNEFLISTGDYYTYGQRGGLEKVKLRGKQSDENHYHYIGWQSDGNNGYFITGTQIDAGTIEWSSTLAGLQYWNGRGHGSSNYPTSSVPTLNLATSLGIGEWAKDAHENRPPYFAVYYIMKLEDEADNSTTNTCPAIRTEDGLTQINNDTIYFEPASCDTPQEMLINYDSTKSSGKCVCSPHYEKNANGDCAYVYEPVTCKDNEEITGYDKWSSSGTCTCSSGYETFNGKCVAVCPTGQPRQDDGSCKTTSIEGTLIYFENYDNSYCDATGSDDYGECDYTQWVYDQGSKWNFKVPKNAKTAELELLNKYRCKYNFNTNGEGIPDKSSCDKKFYDWALETSVYRKNDVLYVDFNVPSNAGGIQIDSEYDKNDLKVYFNM